MNQNHINQFHRQYKDVAKDNFLANWIGQFVDISTNFRALKLTSEQTFNDRKI